MPSRLRDGGPLSSTRFPGTAAGSSNLESSGASGPDGEPADELRPVTALFADVVGSTALAETLPPDEVKALIGECTNRMASAVETLGGEVTAFMGDGIAAFFGLSGAREDDHDRAALAAIEIRRLITEYAEEVEATWGVQEVSVRIGINSGRVAVGSLRATAAPVHALGDAVNVAARLQGIAQPGSILIGSVVAATLLDRFDVVARGSKTVKGRKQAVDVFELVAESSAAHRVPTRPMFGRVSELSRLAAAVREVRAGRGQLALILGEPGIGKTRLLQETRVSFERQTTWLDGRCDPSARRLPYAPFKQTLQDWLELEAGIPDLAVRIRLRARLQELFGNDDQDVFTHLAGILGVELEQKERRRFEGLPLEALAKGLHAAYSKWIEALTRFDPVVLAIDNFAQADEPTVQLTEDLLALTECVPLLLVLSMRADGVPPAWRLRTRGLTEFTHRTCEVTLRPLPCHESDELVASLDVDEVLPSSVKSAIARRAEGNPLYIEELFNAVVGRDSHSTRESALGAVPPGLERLLLSRVDSLSGDARKLLQAAAVIGRSFARSVLERMGVSADPSASLREALRADLIREQRLDPVEYQFKHGLIREAVLATLTRTTGKDLHRRAARAIESCFGPNLENHVEALAEHYEVAGDHENAVEFIEGVADRLASLYRYNEAAHALDLCRRYLDPSHAVTAYTRITKRSAELKGLLGRGDEAVRLVDELLELRDGSVDESARLLAMKAQILTECGALEEASSVIDMYRVVQGTTIEAPLIKCLMAIIRLRRDQLSGARESLESLGDLRSIGDELAFAASSTWAGYHAMLGNFEDGREWAQRSLEVSERVGSIALNLRAERNIGILDMLRGDLDESFTRLRRVWASYHELGARVGEVETAINLVHVAELRGFLRNGWEIGVSSLEVAREPFWLGGLSANLAATALELGDYKRAEALAADVLEVGDEAPAFARFVAFVTIGELYIIRGEWDAADANLLLAKDEAEGSVGREGQRVSVHVALSSSALRQGLFDRARHEGALALDHLPGAERPVHVGAHRAFGAASLAVEDESGRTHLERALRLSRELKMKLEEGRTLAALGSVGGERSSSYFDRAQQLFEECEAERGLAELNELRRR
jgi:class 3 adenylate cyclase/tetratricopeptide (TPR) repeat protein